MRADKNGGDGVLDPRVEARAVGATVAEKLQWLEQIFLGDRTPVSAPHDRRENRARPGVV
jgi:hypothetical protein